MADLPHDKPDDGPSAADVHGPWVEPGDLTSGLIERCRCYWNTPIGALPNGMLATFLRQDIAVAAVLKEAKRRLQAGIVDGSELYDGELGAAIAQIENG